MGKLIKNHWARLIILTAAACKLPSPAFSSPANTILTPTPDQITAGFHCFFWPKIFWDFLTKNLDSAVKPIPILQVVNVILGVVGLAWEWPLPLLAGTGLHRSIEARLIIYPLSALCALLIYQGTNSGLYYIVGMMAYFWAYSEGEVRPTRHSLSSSSSILTASKIVCPEPWTLPKRGSTARKAGV
jgi:hypothetical protein